MLRVLSSAPNRHQLARARFCLRATLAKIPRRTSYTPYVGKETCHTLLLDCRSYVHVAWAIFAPTDRSKSNPISDGWGSAIFEVPCPCTCSYGAQPVYRLLKMTPKNLTPHPERFPFHVLFHEYQMLCISPYRDSSTGNPKPNMKIRTLNWLENYI
jgi:hypothetical protein